MKSILGAITLAITVAVCVPAYADSPVNPAAPAVESCRDKDEWIKSAMAAWPFAPQVHGQDITQVPASALPELVALYDRYPPAMAPMDADSAVAIRGVDGKTGLPVDRVLIGFFKGECKMGSFQPPISLFQGNGDPA